MSSHVLTDLLLNKKVWRFLATCWENGGDDSVFLSLMGLLKSER